MSSACMCMATASHVMNHLPRRAVLTAQTSYGIISYGVNSSCYRMNYTISTCRTTSYRGSHRGKTTL